MNLTLINYVYQDKNLVHLLNILFLSIYYQPMQPLIQLKLIVMIQPSNYKTIKLLFLILYIIRYHTLLEYRKKLKYMLSYI